MRSLNSTEFSVTHSAVTFTFRPDGTLMLSIPGLKVWNAEATSRAFQAISVAPVHPRTLASLLEALHRLTGQTETTLIMLRAEVRLIRTDVRTAHATSHPQEQENRCLKNTDSLAP